MLQSRYSPAIHQVPMPTNEQVIQTQVDAFNARDLARFIDCYSSDIVILDGDGNQMAKGPEGMKQMYGPLFAQSPNLQCEIKKRIMVGQYVIDEEHVTGFNLSGYPSEMRAAAVYRVSGGRITRVQLLL